MNEANIRIVRECRAIHSPIISAAVGKGQQRHIPVFVLDVELNLLLDAYVPKNEPHIRDKNTGFIGLDKLHGLTVYPIPPVIAVVIPVKADLDSFTEGIAVQRFYRESKDSACLQSVITRLNVQSFRHGIGNHIIQRTVTGDGSAVPRTGHTVIEGAGFSGFVFHIDIDCPGAFPIPGGNIELNTRAMGIANPFHAPLRFTRKQTCTGIIIPDGIVPHPRIVVNSLFAVVLKRGACLRIVFRIVQGKGRIGHIAVFVLDEELNLLLDAYVPKGEPHSRDKNTGFMGQDKLHGLAVNPIPPVIAVVIPVKADIYFFTKGIPVQRIYREGKGFTHLQSVITRLNVQSFRQGFGNNIIQRTVTGDGSAAPRTGHTVIQGAGFSGFVFHIDIDCPGAFPIPGGNIELNTRAMGIANPFHAPLRFTRKQTCTGIIIPDGIIPHPRVMVNLLFAVVLERGARLRIVFRIVQGKGRKIAIFVLNAQKYIFSYLDIVVTQRQRRLENTCLMGQDVPNAVFAPIVAIQISPAFSIDKIPKCVPCRQCVKIESVSFFNLQVDDVIFASQSHRQIRCDIFQCSVARNGFFAPGTGHFVIQGTGLRRFIR